MVAIYGMQDSGNCYKPRLLMALTGRPFRHAEISSLNGDTRKAEFLARNPAGQVPVLELDDGRCLAESGAILFFLGEGTPFVPADPFERAQMLQWMFFEQYVHEPAIAVRRALTVYPSRRAAATPERMADLLVRGQAALGVMNAHLEARSFFVGDVASLADIALFAYTHTAEEGGYALEDYPAIVAWLARVAALDGFRPLHWLPDA